jgi:hypothetical protein
LHVFGFFNELNFGQDPAKYPFYSLQSPIATSAKSQKLHIIKLELHSLDEEKIKEEK